MRIPFILFCLLILCKEVKAQRYLFFLHNAFLEIQGEAGVHPEYGKAEYSAITDKFKKAGFIVISELRKRGTDANDYAEKVSRQVDSLIKKGVPAGNITVVGTSKGSYIAMVVSGRLRNPLLNYVFIGCCDDDLPDNPRVYFCGNILSIYEESDIIGRSCDAFNAKAGDDVKMYKEIQLHTSLKHGFLYKPLDAWIEPSIKWAMQDYK